MRRNSWRPSRRRWLTGWRCPTSIRGEVSVEALPGTIRVLIIGGGKGGKALLELFTCGQGVQVVGMADVNPQAPGLALAQNLGIPTSHDAIFLVSQGGADLIVDVSGDPLVAPLIARHKPASAEILGGTSAMLVWKLRSEERRVGNE